MKRPKPHQIAELAESAITDALEPWVVEPIRKDYGKDLRVEVFCKSSNSEEAESTGVEFYIQIKSTNTTRSRDISIFQIRVEHLEYWDSHALPVLLVRFHAPTRTLYSKWTVTIPIKHEQETQRIRIEPTPWDGAIKDQLYEELLFLSDLKQGSLDFPLVVTASDRALFKQLKRFWQGEQLLDVTNLSPSWPSLTTFENNVIVDFGITSIRLKSDSPNICRDITTAIAVILIRHNYSGPGARLLESSLNWSALSSNMAFAFNGNTDMSSNLPMICNRLTLCGRNDVIAQILYGILASTVRDANEMAEIVAEYLLIACCDNDIDTLDDLINRQLSALPAWLCVTLAECYLKLKDADRAAHALDNALEKNARLAYTPRFLRVAGLVAGVQNQIEKAITELKRATQLGDSLASRYVPLMLIDHGRYQDALEHLNQLTDLTDTEEGDRLLLKLALEHIIEVTNITDQIRHPEQAMQISSQLCDSSLSPSQCETILQEAYKADAAWGSVWFNRGAVQQRQGKNSFMDYLSAAALCPNDLTAWIHTMIFSIQEMEFIGSTEPAVEWSKLVISAAKRTNGKDILEELAALPSISYEEDMRDLPYDETVLIGDHKETIKKLYSYFNDIPSGSGLLEIWRPNMGARIG